MATLKTQIQIRRDTAANLANVVLKAGEPGYATDTKKLAIGDGSTKFSSLKDYGALSDLSGYVTLGTAQTITGAKTFDNHIYFTNVGSSSSNSKQIVWGNDTTKYGYVTASTANQFGFGVNNTTIVLIGENYIGPNTSLDNEADLGRSNGAWRNLYIKNKIINGSNEYSLPNKTGTIALTNDIPTVSGFVTGPSSSTDNAIARYDGTTGKIIQNSRATIDDTGNLKINNSSGGDIGLILGRGSNADWRLLGKDGNFYIQGNYTTSKQTSFYDVLTLAYNSGNATVKGSVTANGFKHSNSTTGTNNYILLAGGGTKAISDFASADIGDDYLPLAGGTMTGAIARNYTSASTDPVLKIGSNNFDINIFKVYSGDQTYKATGVYGYNLTYNGTGSGVANALTMYCDNQNASTQVIGWQLNQAGQMGIGVAASTSYRLTVNGSANATTLYENGTSLTNKYVSYTKNNNVSVAGTTKTTYTYGQTAIFAPNGLIMGGTAAAAGLVTRGICGVSTPNATTGACTKDNLYLNFDGGSTTTWTPNGRGVIINAGTPGEDLGSGMYSYCAVRGDIVKAWVEAKGYITSSSLPTVNNGKLTIQRNGTTVATFTANDSDNVTANIIDNDTLNTAGSTNDEAKLYLVGAKSQAASAQTYSDAQVYTQAGELNATSVCVAEHGQIRYDATNECIRFVIA